MGSCQDSMSSNKTVLSAFVSRSPFASLTSLSKVAALTPKLLASASRTRSYSMVFKLASLLIAASSLKAKVLISTVCFKSLAGLSITFLSSDKPSISAAVALCSLFNANTSIQSQISPLAGRSSASISIRLTLTFNVNNFC